MGGVFSSNNIHRNHFHLGEVIGMGTFTKVREVRRYSNHQWYALKEYNLLKMTTTSEAEILLDELNALKRIRKHPFIVELYGAFRDHSSVSFVLELFTAGDLRLSLQSLKIFDEKQVAYVIACIGSALRFLHLNRIIHRDLKPENIMMDHNGVCKLIDFGMSYVMPPKTRVCICDRSSGTREYLAPEVFVQNHYHGYESDFWSLGIVMYELLFRHRPFRGNAPLEMICYSRDTYRTAWELLIKTSQDDFEEINIANPLDDNTVQTLLPDPAPLEIRSFTHPSIIDATLDPQLIPCLPQDEPISEDCKSILLSLIDVRIHSRIGTGTQYEEFSHHPWFTVNGIEVDDLASCPSPIHPDAIHTSDLIFSKFLDSNLEKSETQSKSADLGRHVPNQDIHEMIGSIHYTSPEYLKISSSKL
jgi:serine/threonine protein kinase